MPRFAAGAMIPSDRQKLKNPAAFRQVRVRFCSGLACQEANSR
jgi:hypothetical protein